MDFYLTLPSNSDESTNKTNHFRVGLPNTVNLNGQWEVALVEIMYPYTWPNIHGIPMPTVPGFWNEHTPSAQEINNAENIIWVHYIPLNSVEAIVVPPGYYSSPQELNSAIRKGLRRHMRVLRAKRKMERKEKRNKKIEKDYYNKKLPALQDALTISYDSVLKRVKMKIDLSVINVVTLGRHLQYVLGLDNTSGNLLSFSEKSHTAKYPCDLRAGFYALYIYCDIVESQILANTQVPLLRIVPTEGEHGQIINKTFHTPHYLPLLKKQFNSIEISIKDDRNRHVPFEFGKCILKLHFRKRRPIPL